MGCPICCPLVVLAGKRDALEMVFVEIPGVSRTPARDGVAEMAAHED